MCFFDFPACFQTFKTSCLLNYALMIRYDYDITSSLRRRALHWMYKKLERHTVESFEFALRNRVLLWRCLKSRVLRWTVLIDSSLVGWTVLIDIIALKMILVVILLSRLMKSRQTHLIKNILTVLNEISDCCGLQLLDVILKYRKIISASSEWTLIIAMV
nr:hypothetical protein [Tanacetum cinerariifolium]